jgi:hypothetical protein
MTALGSPILEDDLLEMDSYLLMAVQAKEKISQTNIVSQVGNDIC